MQLLLVVVLMWKVLTYTFLSVRRQVVSGMTVTMEASDCIDAEVITSTILQLTLIYI